ncbi:MAG: hypothetical protein NVS3B10_07410 [Polyangiales bacterium]
MADKDVDETKSQRDAGAPLRGFARLTTEQRRRLGSKGGTIAHQRGTANKFTPEAASAAGRIPHDRGTAHHWTSEQAREAGKKGGAAPRTSRAARASHTAQAVADDDADALQRESAPER